MSQFQSLLDDPTFSQYSVAQQEEIAHRLFPEEFKGAKEATQLQSYLQSRKELAKTTSEQQTLGSLLQQEIFPTAAYIGGTLTGIPMAGPALSLAARYGQEQMGQGPQGGTGRALIPSLAQGAAALLPGGPMKQALYQALSGMLGLGANQTLGIEEPTKGQYALQGAIPLGIGAALRASQGIVSAPISNLQAAQLSQAHAAIPEAEKLAKNLQPSMSSIQRYEQLRESPAYNTWVPQFSPQSVYPWQPQPPMVPLHPVDLSPLQALASKQGAIEKKMRQILEKVGGEKTILKEGMPSVTDFETAHGILRFTNAEIQNATGAELGNLKGIRAATWTALQKSALTPELKLANEAFAQEQGVELLQEITKSSTDYVGGMSFLKGDALLKRFMNVKDDELFVHAMGSHIADIEDFYTKLAQDTMKVSGLGTVVTAGSLGGALGAAAGINPALAGGLAVQLPGYFVKMATKHPQFRNALLYAAELGHGRLTMETIQGLANLADQYEAVHGRPGKDFHVTISQPTPSRKMTQEEQTQPIPY